MFSEVEFSISRSNDNFGNSVKDSFGHSIVNEVYEPIGQDINDLQRGYDEAELKKREIQMLTFELRTIL